MTDTMESINHAPAHTFSPTLAQPSVADSPETLRTALAACADALRAAETVVITSHLNGDGDSIGSSLGLYHALTMLGKSVRVIHPTPLPSNFQFLQGSSAIEVFDPEINADALLKTDVLCVLDANAPKRMSPMDTLIVQSPAQKLVIDHHQDPQAFAHLYAVDTEASSTCEIIYRLAAQMETQTGKQLFTQAFAEAVYTGIMTDTGNFRFPRTDAELHRMIAHLIDCGADPTFIYENVINQNAFNRSLLLGRALMGQTLHHGGKFCIMTVSRRDMDETGTNQDHIEGFVEQTLSIQGVQMGALVVELDDQVKISIRSKGAIAVNQIAAHFGGGGHLNAAGCSTKVHSFAEVQRLLVQLAEPFLV